MDFKFSKDSGDSQQESPGEKKKQSTLLVLLLILVGGFTYLYFFTGLIKPLETQKAAEAPAQQVEKMPLPSREDEPAKPAGTVPEKAEAPKTTATAPVTAAAPVAKPTAAPVKQTPEAVAKAAPAPAPAKPKEEPKKVEAAKTADKIAQPVPLTDKKGDKTAVSKSDEKKPSAAAKKPAAADKKSAAAKNNGKNPVAGAQSAVKAKNSAKDSSMLLIGNYVLEEALSADMGRVRKAGFKPIVKPSAHKKKSMNRLYVSDFNDRTSARSTLEKLKRYTSDAFIIEQGGRFSVYAGSYLQSESANAEKERLKAAGFLTTVKHTSIAIPSQSLSVGPFNSKKDADAALGRLKSAGIKATFVQK
jgi:cell division septation protein DedD